METSAIFFMIVGLIITWGGLAFSIWKQLDYNKKHNK